MLAIEHRFIPGLAPESDLWVRGADHSQKPRWSMLHLVQSDLDSSCGIHALTMALMILNGVSRASALKLSSARRGPLALLWKAAGRHYFEGASGADLLQYVRASDCGLEARRARGSVSRLTSEVASAILAGEVPLLRIEGADFDHWTLISGLEREVSARSTRRLLALLALDPGERAPWLMAYTGRIDLEPRVHRRTAGQVAARRFTYRTLNGECLGARLVELVVLRRAQPPP